MIKVSPLLTFQEVLLLERIQSDGLALGSLFNAPIDAGHHMIRQCKLFRIFRMYHNRFHIRLLYDKVTKIKTLFSNKPTKWLLIRLSENKNKN